MLGLEQKLGSRLVIYADDLVILCKRGRAEEALAYLHARKRPVRLQATIKASKNIYRDTAELLSKGHVFGWF